MILAEKTEDLPLIKQEMAKSKNKITLKKSAGLHDIFIFTSGEGWTVGHSLKDFVNI